MISPVSFSSAAQTQSQTQAVSFEDKIKQPQTYVKPESAAASQINGKEKKGKSKFGTVVKLLAAAAIAVGGVYLAKSGKVKNIFESLKKVDVQA